MKNPKQKNKDPLLDLALAELENECGLDIRTINTLENRLGCIWVKDLLKFPLEKIREINGLGTKQFECLVLCLRKLNDSLEQKG